MNQVLLIDGHNDYKLPHVGKLKFLAKHGRNIPMRLQCKALISGGSWMLLLPMSKVCLLDCCVRRHHSSPHHVKCRHLLSSCRRQHHRCLIVVNAAPSSSPRLCCHHCRAATIVMIAVPPPFSLPRRCHYLHCASAAVVRQPSNCGRGPPWPHTGGG